MGRFRQAQSGGMEGREDFDKLNPAGREVKEAVTFLPFLPFPPFLPNGKLHAEIVQASLHNTQYASRFTSRLVKMGDVAFIAVIEPRWTPFPGVNHPLCRLGPAWMRDARVHICPEVILPRR